MSRDSVERILRLKVKMGAEAERDVGLPSVMSVERFVLEHGREFESQRRPKGIRRRKAGACFMNAYLIAEQRGLTYVEGFAATPSCLSMPIHHAWCIDDAGRVVDATWDEPEASSYFGIPFRFEFVERVTMKARYYVGVLMPRGYFYPPDFDGVESWHP